MPNPAPTYRQLRTKWYRKLKDEGFEDIEKDDNLIDWHSSRFIHKFSPLHIESSLNYYLMAEHFLNRHNFTDEFDLLVWILHSEGVACRKIAEELESQKDKVNKTINRLKKLMRRGY